MTRVLDIADPARGEEAGEFQGRLLGASVSVIVVDAPPGGGPRLHGHPYEEVFVVQEGSATFTAGDDVIEATGRQVVVVPACLTLMRVHAVLSACRTLSGPTSASACSSATEAFEADLRIFSRRG